MKRIILSLTILLAATALVAAFSTPATAKVGGVCSNCHTMHNSQDGAKMAYDEISGPFDYLTRGVGSAGVPTTQCLGCHGVAPGGNENIYAVNVAPQVLHKGNDLAGGNFSYIVNSGKPRLSGDEETCGHNVKDLGIAGVTDDNFTLANGSYPPGDKYGQYGLGLTNTTFTCAGKNGCHGDRNEPNEMEAIKGAHHADDTILKFDGPLDLDDQDGTKSYRFLYGVKGAEDSDWQDSDAAGDHNEYVGTYGAPTDVTRDSPGDDGTISGLCAECHGDFHDAGTYDTDEASPWRRHPTNFQLPSDDTKEYYLYPDEYSIDAPVARLGTFIGGLSSASSTGVVGGITTTAIVMCLSCHRAHASPYEDILRWDYTTMVAGGGAGTGCFICHTEKDD